ncbi:actin-histidine N-methyltransferase-like isoform X1 [Ornithodoros turicata]|uniref:actin-histidine N-methyltransferase-like isoform X1 n=2 Tax=Ornithodoros turicata TaxID=34597 RepID=UPI003139F267
MGRHNKKKGFKQLSIDDRLMLQCMLDEILEKCTKLPSGIPKEEWKDFLELNSLLVKVREIENGITLDLPERTNKWDAFLDWCTKNGADMKHVEIKDIGNGEYGMTAKQAIEEGDEILHVPRKLMMSALAAHSSRLGQLLQEDPVLKSMPNITLALFLILELSSGETSFWSPYISILPDSFNTVLYFSVSDLELLRGSVVLDDALKLHRSILRQYAYFHRILRTHPLAKSLPFKDCFTYDLYRWAVSAVMTRQNAIPAPGGHAGSSTVLALVPLWDMCNHSGGKLCTDYDPEKDELKCLAMRDFQAGDEVTIFYGRRTNSEFLVHNGFVYPGNEHDAVDIKLGISKSDPLFSIKSELCGKHDLPQSGVFSLRSGSHPITEDLSTFLRILILKEEPSGGNISSENIENSPDENARAALAFLRDRIELLLRAFPLSEQDYQSIVTSSRSTPGSRNAALYRLEERKILLSAQRLLCTPATPTACA